MKVIHINTVTFGGAFEAAYRLHKALLAKNVNSQFLAKNSKGALSEKRDIIYGSGEKAWSYYVKKMIPFLKTNKQQRQQYLRRKKGEYEIYSYPFRDQDITSLGAIESADIINLHWVSNFIDYRTFFSKVKKPIVWTLHDCHPFLGGFHHEFDSKENQEEFHSLEKKLVMGKRRIIEKYRPNLTFIGVSEWITHLSTLSYVNRGFTHYTINNSIDVDKYYPKTTAEEMRRKLQLGETTKILLFVSHNLNNRWKGLQIFLNSLTYLMYDNLKLAILLIGSGDVSFKPPLGITIKKLDVQKPDRLPDFYGLADATVIPSLEDNMPNVLLEATVCGCPVIGLPTGGIPEIISPGMNGYVAKAKTASSLAKEIQKIMVNSQLFNRKSISEVAKKRFSFSNQATKYLKIYDEILPCHRKN